MIARFRATVSVSGLSIERSTRIARTSGSQRSTASSSASTPSSTSISAATAVTGFDIDAMRKMLRAHRFLGAKVLKPDGVNVPFAMAPEASDDASRLAAVHIAEHGV